jgi:signal transduction histidine kinase
MSSIIEDIIDMAKFKHNNFIIQEELFDLRSLINDVVELLGE